MQDRPIPNPDETTGTEPARTPGTRRIGRWITRRRKTIAFQFVRGVSYGAGAGAVGLIIWWIETR